MQPNVAEAAELLAQAERTRNSVQSQGAKESRAFLAAGLFVLLFVPPFDFVSGELWGPVSLAAAILGAILMARYVSKRSSKVRLRSPVKWWVWMVWTAWYCAMLVLTGALQGHLPFPSTLAAIGSALPLLAYGVRLAQRGQ